jgi:hypothetical protein
MSTPVSGSISWQTPVTINSGDVVTATDLNNLNKDVAFLRARPWITVYGTSGTANLQPTAYSNTNPYGGTYIFATGQLAYAVLNSTSAVGSFSAPGNGAVYFPSGLAGMYRVTAQMMINADSTTAHCRMIAVLYAGGVVVGYIPGSWVLAANDHHEVATLNFMIPGNVAGSIYGGAIDSIVFLGQSTVASSPKITAGDFGTTPHNPTTTPKQFNTFATIEYLGTSTGAY